MRPSSTPAELEARRRLAAKLLKADKTLSEVATLVGSSVSSVKRWKDALEQGGLEALKAKPHPGRKPRMTARDQQRLLKILSQGARKAGFPTDLWTCKRVAQVIEDKFDVTFHVDYVGTLLHKLDWSPQKPEQRARERDEQAIARWRKRDWPRIKKGDSRAS